MDSDLMASKLHDESRRMSYVDLEDDYDFGRRSSFANKFLDSPSDYDPSRKTKLRLSNLHQISPEDLREIEFMSTPPITPLKTHLRTTSQLSATNSYFTYGRESESQPTSPLSTVDHSSIFNNIFETFTKAGEAMDLHDKAVNLANVQRSSKGKGKATEPKEARETRNVDTKDKTKVSFEDALVDVFDSAEAKVNQIWSWWMAKPVEDSISSIMTKSQEVSHDKPCTMCGEPRSVLIRCQIDASEKWNFICPGKCWKSVSGGIEDARGHEAEFPHYRYGGMWKNKHADGAMSAKKPRAVKTRQQGQMEREKTVS